VGCDIHAHVEIKIDGQWHHYNHPSVDRRYELFARMADVRNSTGIDPIAPPRGLPDDITFTTRFDHDEGWGSDAHSESWLSAQEVTELDEWMRDYMRREYMGQGYSIERDFGYIFGNGWDIKKYPSDYPKQLEDARLVFWFDN
jgi:hypothetical protein